ncbi:Ring-h2 zinc finger protein [Thalictrum thalictroides]|uniref:Ring-h2 zinc finger protein n=1 Tax=Thalictrum thalictroides TaxID=46969 RepID=A0A7J6VJA3_THATH|nr:Ring-h2 zinc finger protein [Thalictrum thalictroides]
MLPSKPNNPNSFSTPESLFHWLKPRLPSHSFDSWGIKPGTKNIHNLWLELSQGESLISIDSGLLPIRTVNVVIVRILNENGSVLIEAQQELSDGTFRERIRPLSEKMKPGENVESAVIRAVKEELGSIINGDIGSIVRIVPGSYEKKVEEKESSVSYPGLPVCYVLHSVEACVDGLPDEDFSTEEEGEYEECSEVNLKVADKAVFVKKHFWKWVGASNST